jgi:hypothetical protein
VPDRFRASIQFGFVGSQVQWRSVKGFLRTRDAGEQQRKSDGYKEIYASTS